MTVPDHEKLRRELEAAASKLRTATERRRKVIGPFLWMGLLVAAGAITLVVSISGTSARGPVTPPAAPSEAAVSPQSPRRASPRPPASSSGPDVPPQPGAPVDAERPTVHTVEPGETLARIAMRYRVPWEQLAADNALADPDRIRAGLQLTVRPAPAGVETIEPGTTLSDYARRTGLSVEQLLALNPQITDPDRITAGGRLRLA